MSCVIPARSCAGSGSGPPGGTVPGGGCLRPRPRASIFASRALASVSCAASCARVVVEQRRCVVDLGALGRERRPVGGHGVERVVQDAHLRAGGGDRALRDRDVGIECCRVQPRDLLSLVDIGACRHRDARHARHGTEAGECCRRRDGATPGPGRAVAGCGGCEARVEIDRGHRERRSLEGHGVVDDFAREVPRGPGPGTARERRARECGDEADGDEAGGRDHGVPRQASVG